MNRAPTCRAAVSTRHTSSTGAWTVRLTWAVGSVMAVSFSSLDNGSERPRVTTGTQTVAKLCALPISPAEQEGHPMIELRSKDSLGRFDFGWLDTTHHFSFGEYHDPARMGWGRLRVWNDDKIAPGAGFPAHPHANFEIITYVRDGAITHKDSQNNESHTKANNVQVM